MRKDLSGYAKRLLPLEFVWSLERSGRRMRIYQGASAFYTAGVGLLNADWLQQANALQ